MAVSQDLPPLVHARTACGCSIVFQAVAMIKTSESFEFLLNSTCLTTPGSRSRLSMDSIEYIAQRFGKPFPTLTITTTAVSDASSMKIKHAVYEDPVEHRKWKDMHKTSSLHP